MWRKVQRRLPSLFSLCVNQISGYTLTVLASDNGNPARSSSATVNIDVSDVNDNPPVFSLTNYSLVVQVKERLALVSDEEGGRFGALW